MKHNTHFGYLNIHRSMWFLCFEWFSLNDDLCLTAAPSSYLPNRITCEWRKTLWLCWYLKSIRQVCLVVREGLMNVYSVDSNSWKVTASYIWNRMWLPYWLILKQCRGVHVTGKGVQEPSVETRSFCPCCFLLCSLGICNFNITIWTKFFLHLAGISLNKTNATT